MNDKWLTELRDRMTDFEIEEPQNLWPSIENGLMGISSGPVVEQSVQFPYWFNRYSAAIVIAVLFSITCWMIVGEREHINPIITEIPSPSSDNLSGMRTEETFLANTPIAISKKTIVAIRNERKTEITHESPESEAISEPESGLIEKEFPSDSSELSRGIPSIQIASRQKSTSGIASTPPLRGQYSSRNLQLNVSFGSGVKTLQNALDDILPPLMDLDPPVPKEDPISMTHNFPFRVGISVAYRLNNRLSIESGLSYAYLSSHLKYASTSPIRSGSQKLHYLGLPIRASYRFWSWKTLDFYVAGGGMVEKSVSGSLERTIAVEGENILTEKSSVHERQLQFSLNGSLGLRFNISPAVGLYAEPEVSYYFDNNSSVRTFYKDNPMNVNLNLGIRFSLNK